MSQRRNTLLGAMRHRHAVAALAVATAGLAACSAEQVTAPERAAPNEAPSTALVGTTTTRMTPYSSLSLSSTTFNTYRTSWYTGSGDQFTSTLRPKAISCPASSATLRATVGSSPVAFVSGKNEFRVPSGALPTATAITVTFKKSSSGLSMDLQPHGLKFNKPTELVFDLTGCNVPAGATLNVYYVDGYNRVMQVMPSTTSNGITRALTDHFSGFTVAWGVM